MPLTESVGLCDPTVRKDCWSVTPSFMDEHAMLFDTAIRCRAALKMAHDKLD